MERLLLLIDYKKEKILKHLNIINILLFFICIFIFFFNVNIEIKKKIKIIFFNCILLKLYFNFLFVLLISFLIISIYKKYIYKFLKSYYPRYYIYTKYNYIYKITFSIVEIEFSKKRYYITTLYYKEKNLLKTFEILSLFNKFIKNYTVLWLYYKKPFLFLIFYFIEICFIIILGLLLSCNKYCFISFIGIIYFLSIIIVKFILLNKVIFQTINLYGIINFYIEKLDYSEKIEYILNNSLKLPALLFSIFNFSIPLIPWRSK